MAQAGRQKGRARPRVISGRTGRWRCHPRPKPAATSTQSQEMCVRTRVGCRTGQQRPVWSWRFVDFSQPKTKMRGRRCRNRCRGRSHSVTLERDRVEELSATSVGAVLSARGARRQPRVRLRISPRQRARRRIHRNRGHKGGIETRAAHGAGSQHERPARHHLRPVFSENPTVVDRGVYTFLVRKDASRPRSRRDREDLRVQAPRATRSSYGQIRPTAAHTPVVRQRPSASR